MKNTRFWNITPRTTLKVNRQFGGTCRLHLQGGRISQARNQREADGIRSWLCLPPEYRTIRSACHLLHAGFLLGLFFDPEDGGNMFLRHVVDFERTTWRYIPGDRTLHYLQIFCPFILIVLLYQIEISCSQLFYNIFTMFMMPHYAIYDHSQELNFFIVHSCHLYLW
jgi:hypothetical protein